MCPVLPSEGCRGISKPKWVDYDTCLEAAGARLLEALALHDRREHAGAHYLAGLAAECVLRAYYLRIKPESEG